jgi:TPR repeat protein
VLIHQKGVNVRVLTTAVLLLSLTAVAVAEDDKLAVCKAGSLKDCIALCGKGEPVACMFAGVIHGEAGDPRAGAPFLQKACDASVLAACTNLAAQYELGEGVARDIGRAVALFTTGCDGQEPRACYNLGRLYVHGAEGLAKDAKKGTPFLEKACGKAEAAGCYELGLVHYLGKTTGDKDFARALPAFDAGCKGGHAESCANLGAMYVNGEGVAKDLSRARSLFKKGCQGGSRMACQVLQQLGG